MKYLLSSYKNDPASYNLIKASLLQKLIRRGMVNEANFVASLYLQDNQEKGLRRRLQIITAEDIGIGWPMATIFVKNEKDLIKITSALAQAPKNRESDRFLLCVANKIQSFKNHKDSNVINEVSLLDELFTETAKWFNEKNSINLKNLKNTLSKIETNTLNSEIIKELNVNYLELTKAKIHGARCQLALAVLLFTRQISKNDYIFEPDLTKTELSSFDEIFDFAIDMHTPIGKKLNRGFDHWVKNCVEVNPELKYPTLYDQFGNEKYPLDENSNKFKK